MCRTVLRVVAYSFFLLRFVHEMSDNDAGIRAEAMRRMDEKLPQFQVEVRLGQEEAAAKVVKKARYEKPYTFRRKANEAPAHFNARVDEALAQAGMVE